LAYRHWSFGVEPGPAIKSRAVYVLVCLAQFSSTAWAVDLRDQCRSGTNPNRKINSDRAKHLFNMIGVRVLGAKSHEFRALWCGRRGMQRLPPVYEERQDSASNDATQVGELPRKERAVGLPPATS
jgi:hypothetical protein